jgi:superfamily II DNA/RNA helicase
MVEAAAHVTARDGPVSPSVLVLAPTRELAMQTEKAALALQPGMGSSAHGEPTVRVSERESSVCEREGP